MKGSTTLTTEPSASPSRPVVLAHLSDLHLDATTEARARGVRVAGYLAGLTGQVDAVLVSGDVSDRAAASDYALARLMLGELPVPVLWAVGNHDERTAFAAGLLGRPEHPPGEPLNQVLDLGAVRLVVLDSLWPGHTAGYLAGATLDWLDTTLAAAPAVPALVALHHPPAVLGLPRLDPSRLVNAADLAGVLTGHPQVAAVLCGHAHAAVSSWFAGRPLRVAPGVRSSAVLPWEQPDAPDGAPLMTTVPPVALAFHTYADGVLTTYVRAL